MRLKGPTPNGQVSHQGMTFQCDQDGVLDIPDANAEFAQLLVDSFGFTRVPAALIDKLARPAGLTKTDAPAAPIDPATATRDAMKEWLDARGVAYPGNISNERLREIVAQELGPAAAA